MPDEEYQRVRAKFLELQRIEEEERRAELANQQLQREDYNLEEGEDKDTKSSLLDNRHNHGSSEYNPYKKSRRVDIRHNYYKPLKWCYKCSHLKPNRTHHCSCCNSCTLRMDHHCPYINQCVGYFNHKIFVLFLFYTNLGLLATCITYISRIVVAVSGDVPLTMPQGFLLAINIIILALFFPGVIVLLVNEIYGIIHNRTRIELWLEHWASWDAREKGQKYIYPYNLGVMKNLHQFFGESKWMWLLPTVPSGDGLSFPNIVRDDQLHLFLQNNNEDIV